MMKKKCTWMILMCAIYVLLTACSAGKQQDAFQNWEEDAVPITALKEYVDKVTDEKSEYYIPVEDRIAMFDLDGTLYCETFPIYGEWLLFADYVLNTPGYQAPEHIRAVAEELAAIEKASDIPSHMEETHIKAHAEAFAGMTIEDYYEVVEAYKSTAADGFNGMTRGEAFYLPML